MMDGRNATVGPSLLPLKTLAKRRFVNNAYKDNCMNKLLPSVYKGLIVDVVSLVLLLYVGLSNFTYIKFYPVTINSDL